MIFCNTKLEIIPIGQGDVISVAGKRAHIGGDSNFQYMGDELKTYLEETFGLIVTNSAYAGATWETPNGPDTLDNSGVGQVNKIIAGADSSGLLPGYDAIVFMLGTNCTNEGELTDTSDDVSTMCGAMKYCMEKLAYFGRQIFVGVVIPIRSDAKYSAPVALPSKFQKILEIARLYGIPTMDLYTEGRVIPNGMTPDGDSYYLTDSVHLGANGKLQVKRDLGQWIVAKLQGS